MSVKTPVKANDKQSVKIADLPPAVRTNLDALARQLHGEGIAPSAIESAVYRVAADRGYLLSGSAILIREAVPELANWSPLADWQAALRADREQQKHVNEDVGKRRSKPTACDPLV